MAAAALLPPAGACCSAVAAFAGVAMAIAATERPAVSTVELAVDDAVARGQGRGHHAGLLPFAVSGDCQRSSISSISLLSSCSLVSDIQDD